MTNEVKEVMSHIEKFIKGGRLVFELLTKDEANEMTPRQLCVDYDYDNKVARLFTMNDQNEIVPIKSKAEDIIEEFLIKFIEVSKNKKYDYNPSLHFKILRDGEGFTQAHINEFYNYMTEHFGEMKPYIQYVKDYNGVNHALCPFTSTDAVFIDLGKIIKDKGITNTTTAIKELYSFITAFEESMRTLISNMNSSIDNIIRDMRNDLNNLKNFYGETIPSLNNLERKLNELDAKISTISDTYLKKYKSKTINVSNSGIRQILVRSSKKTGIVISGSIKANPSSPVIVYLENDRGSKWIVELFQNGYITDIVPSNDPVVVKVLSNGGTVLLNNIKEISNGYSLSVTGPLKITVLSRDNDIDILESGTGTDDPKFSRIASSTGSYFYSNSILVTNAINYNGNEISIR